MSSLNRKEIRSNVKRGLLELQQFRQVCLTGPKYSIEHKCYTTQYGHQSKYNQTVGHFHTGNIRIYFFFSTLALGTHWIHFCRGENYYLQKEWEEDVNLKYTQALSSGINTMLGSPELKMIRMRPQNIVCTSLHVQAPVVNGTYKVLTIKS